MVRFVNGPYWGATNLGTNLGLGFQTGLGGETVGGNVSVYFYDVAESHERDREVSSIFSCFPTCRRNTPVT